MSLLKEEIKPTMAAARAKKVNLKSTLGRAKNNI
jgi:hypothetical protein